MAQPIALHPQTSLDPATELFRKDVLAGLSARRKSLPTKYLYDEAGSHLFEAICDLPEYYLTRVETALLKAIAPDLRAAIPKDAALVELGSGASLKTRILLDAAPQIAAYVPVDISPSALEAAAASLADDFPTLAIVPVEADFTKNLHLPPEATARPCVGFFPGSTIGNFSPDDAVELLTSAHDALGADARFILGADLAKRTDILIPAYDDAQGVTASFNRNLLTRINSELDADFNLDAFKHRAVWNEKESRIEMHLVSEADQSVHIAGETVNFAPGETIHTENSYKYTYAMLAELAARAGWHIEDSWVSDPYDFAVLLMKPV